MGNTVLLENPNTWCGGPPDQLGEVSRYNALQMEIRRRFSHWFGAAGELHFQKLLTDVHLALVRLALSR